VVRRVRGGNQPAKGFAPGERLDSCDELSEL
jgi:hypothetical protein